jgi:dienelactone hydrolase
MQQNKKEDSMKKIRSDFTGIIKTIIIAGSFLSIVFASNAGSEMVTFNVKLHNEKTLALTGRLMKPGSEGPFPAVVLLHGCGGMVSESAQKMYNTWASRLASWGYVTLQVDSLSPRNKTNICGESHGVTPRERMYDAFAGKSYLESLSYVDDKQIAVMGWSHGGWSTFYAVDKQIWEIWGKIISDPFKASIAFYPWCRISITQLSSPLLILIGEEDDWTPADRCKNIQLVLKTPHKVTLKVYPKAHHAFDREGADKIKKGHLLRYNPDATEDAIIQVKNFLATHLQ